MRFREANHNASFDSLREIEPIAAQVRTWPEVKIIVHGDSGFCRNELMSGCDRRILLSGLERRMRARSQRRSQNRCEWPYGVARLQRFPQFSVGTLSTRSTTTISVGNFRDTNLSPSCSCKAVKMEGGRSPGAVEVFSAPAGAMSSGVHFRVNS